MNLEALLPQFSEADWLLHGFVVSLNLILFLFAKPILSIVDQGLESETKVRIFRALNVLVLILVGLDLLLISLYPEYARYFIRLGYSLMIVYASIFVYSLCSYLSRRRFGNKKSVDDKDIYLDTYSSRLVDIVLLFIIVLSTIYTLIKVWGADSMLETTGVFGIIIAFIAFTSNIWAPDIISGLVILNTEILEDGDVVVVDGHPDEYIISKVTLVYVILYDVRNNHRTLIRNNQFIKNKIDNISRIASTDGVRQALVFNIGYPDIKHPDKEARAESLRRFKAQVERMFTQANEFCMDNDDIKTNDNRPFEWALTNAGDYALEYTLWVYLCRTPSTKVTSTVRKHLMGTIYKVNEAVFDASIVEGLDLSTPTLIQLDQGQQREAIQKPETRQKQETIQNSES